MERQFNLFPVSSHVATTEFFFRKVKFFSVQAI